MRRPAGSAAPGSRLGGSWKVGGALTFASRLSSRWWSASTAAAIAAEAEVANEAAADRGTAAGASTAVVADPPAATTEWIMPAAERVLSEYQISADAITPTGPGGRLLKEDVLNYVRTKGLKPTDSQPAQPAPASTPPKPIPPFPSLPPTAKPFSPGAFPLPLCGWMDEWVLYTAQG